MTDLDNSKRVSLQATYTPIKSEESTSEKVRPWGKRPFEQWNLVTSVKPTHTEIAYVKKNHKKLANHNNSDEASSRKDFLKTVNTIESVIPELNSPNVLHNVRRFSDINPDTLANVVEDIIKFRKSQVDSAIKSSNSIFDMYKQKTLQHQAKLLPRRGISEKQEQLEAQPQRPSTISPKEMKLKTLIDWSIESNIADGTATQILDVVEKLPVSADEMTVESLPLIAYGSYVIDVSGFVEAFRKRMKVEPIGYLHLERLSFTPAGIERGELVYSVPLSPGEEVNISHKEWSNTSEEFQRIVTDFMENFSEEGVTEKSDLAQSSNSQQQHTDGYNLSVTASGGYGPVNITASAGYNASNSSNNSQQLARTHGMSITHKASARVTKEHKTSFKVASASGTEDQAVRKIKNPFSDRATRTDYYQLLRKWRVDLSRYGVRLTYDITIPEPGSDILTKIREIASIKKALSQGFPPFVGPSLDPEVSPLFELNPKDLSRENYTDWASKYNTIVDDPPPKVLNYSKHQEKDWKEFQTTGPESIALELDIDKRYDMFDVNCTVGAEPWPRGYEGGDVREWMKITAPDGVSNIDFKQGGGSENPILKSQFKIWLMTAIRTRSGNIPIIYQTYHLRSSYILFDIVLHLKDSAFQEWQFKAWGTIRDAARSQYEQNRQILEKRLVQLNEELGSIDPLSLRKIEREEVMKGVMRWLFGPTWKFTRSGIPKDLYDQGTHAILDADIWKSVTLQGDEIKFLHHAIEWENMLYFLYPYFWSHPTRWEEKKYLNHPDIMHRTFLKSGAARVVLTIRPGFEKAFVSFIESGSLLPNQSKEGYVTIADEMKNYAMTNYPGIPTANPDTAPRPLLLPKQQQAWKEMQDIMKLLLKYHDTHHTYPEPADFYPKKHPDPTKPEDPSVLEEYIEGKKPLGVLGVRKLPKKDPWGNNYGYKYPGIHGDYDLISYGAKGKDGGGPALKQDGTPNENAFITSWAESSLIGTWFEYTPTSALDIAFNEKLPEA